MQTSANVLFNRTCRVTCPSGEPRPHSGPFGHSEARRPQGSGLYRRPVSGGLFRGRGPLPGSAAQDHSGTLRQQGEWIPTRPCWFRVLSTPAPPTSPGPDAAERGSGSGRRGLVHLPDGLHRFLRGGAAAEGEPRTRKSGRWTRPLCWSSAGGEKSSWDVFDGVQNQTCPISFRPGSLEEA